jgi:hypothetical protein
MRSTPAYTFSADRELRKPPDGARDAARQEQGVGHEVEDGDGRNPAAPTLDDHVQQLERQIREPKRDDPAAAGRDLEERQQAADGRACEPRHGAAIRERRADDQGGDENDGRAGVRDVKDGPPQGEHGAAARGRHGEETQPAAREEEQEAQVSEDHG